MSAARDAGRPLRERVIATALGMNAAGINRAKETGDTGVILITHFTRILNYVRPDFVHVFLDGRIVAEGGPELADSIEADGYERFTKAGV